MSFRDKSAGRVKARERCVAWLLFAIMGLAPAAAQQPDQAPAAQRLPVGLRLNEVSVYTGNDWLRILDSSSPGLEPLWLLTSGAAADVSAEFGQRARFSAGYHAGYSYNQKFPALRGVDHAVSLDFRTDPERRTIFSMSAAGATGTISEALFDPRYALRVVQQATTINDLASGLGASSPGAILDSPIELGLSGGMRRSGSVQIGVMHRHSRRLTSFVHLGAAREIHSYHGEQQVIVQYPNVTIAMADAGVTYEWSSRTRLTGLAGYTRSYSRLYRADWQTAGLGIERLIGQRSFASVQAGYARMAGAEAQGFGRSSYTLAGTLGTMKGFHTVAATVRRGVADLHGLNGESNLAFEGVWNWAPHSSGWSFGGNLGYERLHGAGMGNVQAWIGQAKMVRRLAAHFRLEFSGVYLTDSGQEVVGLTRRGFRVALVWTPGRERTR